MNYNKRIFFLNDLCTGVVFKIQPLGRGADDGDHGLLRNDLAGVGVGDEFIFREDSHHGNACFSADVDLAQMFANQKAVVL